MIDQILQEDVDNLGTSQTFERFAGSTLLVTGSTGLIGSLMVKGALAWNDGHDGKMRVLAVARNEQKAHTVFEGLESRDDFQVIIADIATHLELHEQVDWISHGASLTASADFAARPVEVATTELDGTRNMLELARQAQVKGMVYLSSLEVYGNIDQDHGEVYEGDEGVLDRFVPRNSYPSAKRMCEALCAAYASEYGVPVKIARLAQTFGAGVAPNDGRIFAQFARAAIAGEPIVMHTPGTGSRCYCYTSDAVEGLLAVLAQGEAGQAYNVSNPNTYCSAANMAQMVAERYRKGGVTLTFDCPDDLASFGFAAPSFVKMNSDKLASLGWTPHYDLPEMYDRLIASMKCRSEQAE